MTEDQRANAESAETGVAQVNEDLASPETLSQDDGAEPL